MAFEHFVVHIPHNSFEIPESYKNSFCISEKEVFRQQLFRTDAHTAELFCDDEIAKVENISNSMDLRSYGKCKGRTWYSEHPATKGDYIARGGIVLIFAWCAFYVIFFRNIHAPLVDFWCPWVPQEISGYWF